MNYKETPKEMAEKVKNFYVQVLGIHRPAGIRTCALIHVDGIMENARTYWLPQWIKDDDNHPFLQYWNAVRTELMMS